MSENKTKPSEQSVSAFVDALPDASRRSESNITIDLLRRVTGQEPKMWGPSIIGFGHQRYKHESGREGEMPIVSFSPRKNAIVLYGMTGFAGCEDVLARLGKHTTGKACIYIKKLVEVRLDVLEELVKQAITRS